MSASQSNQIESAGYAICRGTLDTDQITMLSADLDTLATTQKAGIRNLLQALPSVRSLATSPLAVELVKPILGEKAFPVRSIFFDKTPDTNWTVAWHQDLSIAVKSRHEVDGYGPWSEKDGVLHVQPPLAILENMLTLRFHLDDTDESNGALFVIPKSHSLGRIPVKDIPAHVAGTQPAICSAKAGDVLLMRPLILHSSRKSTAQKRRRIIHIEYSGCSLPETLQWYESLLTATTS